MPFSRPLYPPLIVIMGVSGSGKSTLAQALAARLHYRYLDADDLHSDAARQHMASGQPLTDAMREPWIARVCTLLAQHQQRGSACVLAFSGLRRAHRERLRAAGLEPRFIFLCGDKSTIQERLQQRTGHFMPVHLLDSQLDSLEPPDNEADVLPLALALSTEQQITQLLNQLSR